MVLSRPGTYPVWAIDNVVDDVSGQNNVTTPPTEKQMYGWARADQPPRQWFNWLGRYTYQWLAYLGQQEAQSVVTSDNTGATPIVDPVGGGMATINVIDTGNPANFYQGITYIPQPTAVEALTLLLQHQAP